MDTNINMPSVEEVLLPIENQNTSIPDLVTAVTKAFDRLIFTAEELRSSIRNRGSTRYRQINDVVKLSKAIKTATVKMGKHVCLDQDRNMLLQDIGIIEVELERMGKENQDLSDTAAKYKVAIEKSVESYKLLFDTYKILKEENDKLLKVNNEDDKMRKEAEEKELTTTNFEDLRRDLMKSLKDIATLRLAQNKQDIKLETQKEENRKLKQHFEDRLSSVEDQLSKVKTEKQELYTKVKDLEEHTDSMKRKGILGDMAFQAQTLLWALLFPEDYLNGKHADTRKMKTLAFSKDSGDQEKLNKIGFSSEKVFQHLKAIKLLKDARFIDYHPGKHLEQPLTDKQVQRYGVEGSCYDQALLLWEFGKKALDKDSDLLRHEHSWTILPVEKIKKNFS